MHRRALIVGTLSLALARTRPGAGEVVTFDRQAFAAAQAAGRSIVVFVHAPW
jgi:tRNA A58 N-methylase Trm61